MEKIASDETNLMQQIAKLNKAEQERLRKLEEERKRKEEEERLRQLEVLIAPIISEIIAGL